METNNLSRAFMIGAVLAVAIVGLFLLMYFVVLAGQADLTRLIGSFLVPPIVLGVGLGIYYVVAGKKEA